MSDVALQLDRIGKRYRLHPAWSDFTLREGLAQLFRRSRGEGRRDFWALRDVTFELRRGETLGVIGANGAGKSTLLKILSRITVPTTGRLDVFGKLSALLEVSAGFHPDLTGRENVYLNAAIMGMRRSEIDAKFERIVSFAELTEFIDTPVKHYSSGMQVRLGFSVAAHVDPDIFLVDEVLAVGDAGFQLKCLNRLAELREQARTIMLVSHSMANIAQYSDRVLWIDRGRVRASGAAEPIIEDYLRVVTDPLRGVRRSADADDAPVRVTAVNVVDGRGQPLDMLAYGREAVLEIGYEILAPVDDPVIRIVFEDVQGRALGGVTTRVDRVKLVLPRGVARLGLTPVLFTRGAYWMSIVILDGHLRRHLTPRPSRATFLVEGPSVASREVVGHVVYPHRWEIEEG